MSDGYVNPIAGNRVLYGICSESSNIMKATSGANYDKETVADAGIEPLNLVANFDSSGGLPLVTINHSAT